MIHCHAANVVHGDLKPPNVLLARSRADRRGFTAKVRELRYAGVCHVGCQASVSFTHARGLLGLRAMVCQLQQYYIGCQMVGSPVRRSTDLIARACTGDGLPVQDHLMCATLPVGGTGPARTSGWAPCWK